MPDLDWQRIQARLHKLGFDTGPIDGIRGRRTIRAIKRFQESRGLVADGLIGVTTHAALFGGQPPGTAPRLDRMPWFDEAVRLRGLKEKTGEGSNPEVLDLAKTLNLDYGDDDIPWCGLFVGHCIASALPDEPLPSNPLSSRGWERLGVPVDPQRGAVMVFWREKKTSGLGHAGFYVGENGDDYLILGGNQGDEVNIMPVPKDRFVAARWPLTGLSADGQSLTGGPGQTPALSEPV